MTLFLSFSGAEGFRGVIVIDDCVGVEEALSRVTKAGLNPGGEVAAWPIPSSEPYPRMTLLTRAYLIETGHKSLKDVDDKTADEVSSKALIICDDCN